MKTPLYIITLLSFLVISCQSEKVEPKNDLLIKNKAVLRFRLIPTQWKLIGKTLTSEYCSITFGADVEITRLELIDGKESRYYYQESTLPVIELEVHKSGTITTEVNF